MNTAMQMMPMMGNMMGGMNPMMMNGIMPMMGMPMMGGMPGMAMPMPMMMCKMTCTMTPNGMTCEMTPMDASMKDMFMQCCQNMMSMMNTGMPMMVNCGGMVMMCMMPAKMAK